MLAVDDHVLVRAGIAALVGLQSDMQMIGEASDGIAALELFRAQRPDVTLMDLRIPGLDGIETLTSIRAEFPDAKVIVLTTYAGDAHVARAFRAGARAYLLKGVLHRELLETIRAVHAGQRRIDGEVAAQFAESRGEDGLTGREMEVLRLVAEGNSNKSIASQLAIGEETVKGHVRSILAKLNANDRTHAVTIGLRRGILTW